MSNSATNPSPNKIKDQPKEQVSVQGPTASSKINQLGQIRKNVRTFSLGLISGGVVTGIFAGTMMIVFSMIVSAYLGQGFWTPLYAMGGLFWGVNALIGGASVAAVGFVIHGVVSALFGLGFSWMTSPRIPVTSALTGGLIYGLGVWGVMNYLVLPWSNPVLNARVQLTPGLWLAQHLLFGASLCVMPLVRQWIVNRQEGLKKAALSTAISEKEEAQRKKVA